MKQTGLLLILAALLLAACGVGDGPAAAAKNLPTDPPPAATSTPRPAATPAPSATPAATATPSPEPAATQPPDTPTPAATPTPSPTPTPRIRQLTQGDCCTRPFWASDTEIRFIDRDPETGQTGVWAIDVSRDVERPAPTFVTDRLGITSPTGRYFAYPDRSTGLAVIEEVETGDSWTLDLNENAPNFTPDGERLLWVDVDPDVPFEERTLDLRLADVRGENAQRIQVGRRGSVVAWLDEETLLLSLFENEAGDSRFAIEQTTLARYSLADGSITELLQIPRPRGLDLNPSGTALVYYSAFNEDPADNGVWYVDLTAPDPAPRALPILGSYQWRDDRTLVYVPFDPEAESHFFYSFDVVSGETRQLTSEAQPRLKIANGDWSLSPDGSRIVLVASKPPELDGIWLVELSP